MINELINQEKLDYAAKVYNPNNICKVSDEDLQLSIQDSLFMEHLLAKIRGETIKYSSRKKRSQQLHTKELTSKIESLESDPNPENWDKLTKYKQELKEIRGKDLEGLKIRTRASWLIDGEKPSKYLSALEKKTFHRENNQKVKKR